LPREIDYLRRHDEALRRIMNTVEMPDRLAENLLMLIRQNEGKLPKRRRAGEFKKLTDAEVTSLEAVVNEAFEGFNAQGPRRANSMTASSRRPRTNCAFQTREGHLFLIARSSSFGARTAKPASNAPSAEKPWTITSRVATRTSSKFSGPTGKPGYEILPHGKGYDVMKFVGNCRGETPEMMVRAVGVEPTRALRPCGFSCRLRLSPP
jgi:hypothetical protein